MSDYNRDNYMEETRLSFYNLFNAMAERKATQKYIKNF